MGKNGYLERRDQMMQKFFMVACDTTTQQFFDYMCIVLNDPEIMGKDTFGAKRLKKVYDAMKELDKTFSEAWCGSQESDYYQEKLDAKLKDIFGEVVPFRERYPYQSEWNYNKPMKKG